MAGVIALFMNHVAGMACEPADLETLRETAEEMAAGQRAVNTAQSVPNIRLLFRPDTWTIEAPLPQGALLDTAIDYLRSEPCQSDVQRIPTADTVFMRHPARRFSFNPEFRRRLAAAEVARSPQVTREILDQAMAIATTPLEVHRVRLALLLRSIRIDGFMTSDEQATLIGEAIRNVPMTEPPLLSSDLYFIAAVICLREGKNRECVDLLNSAIEADKWFARARQLRLAQLDDFLAGPIGDYSGTQCESILSVIFLDLAELLRGVTSDVVKIDIGRLLDAEAERQSLALLYGAAHVFSEAGADILLERVRQNVAELGPTLGNCQEIMLERFNARFN